MLRADFLDEVPDKVPGEVLDGVPGKVPDEVPDEVTYDGRRKRRVRATTVSTRRWAEAAGPGGTGLRQAIVRIHIERFYSSLLLGRHFGTDGRDRGRLASYYCAYWVFHRRRAGVADSGAIRAVR